MRRVQRLALGLALVVGCASVSFASPDEQEKNAQQEQKNQAGQPAGTGQTNVKVAAKPAHKLPKFTKPGKSTGQGSSTGGEQPQKDVRVHSSGPIVKTWDKGTPKLTKSPTATSPDIVGGTPRVSRSRHYGKQDVRRQPDSEPKTGATTPGIAGGTPKGGTERGYMKEPGKLEFPSARAPVKHTSIVPKGTRPPIKSAGPVKDQAGHAQTHKAPTKETPHPQN